MRSAISPLPSNLRVLCVFVVNMFLCNLRIFKESADTLGKSHLRELTGTFDCRGSDFKPQSAERARKTAALRALSLGTMGAD
jgi:hypothetical protein